MWYHWGAQASHVPRRHLKILGARRMTRYQVQYSGPTNIRRHHTKFWGRVEQSVLLLATGWTVLGSKPGGGEILSTCPDRPWGPPSLLYNGYRVFPEGKERPGRVLIPHPLLVLWSWKGSAIPLHPLWAVRPVQSLSACTRVTFTFFIQNLVATDNLAPEICTLMCQNL